MQREDDTALRLHGYVGGEQWDVSSLIATGVDFGSIVKEGRQLFEADLQKGLLCGNK